MIKNWKLYVVVLCISFGKINAQDAHFSQYLLAHQELNPAMNGLFEGQYRVGVQYRDQYSSIVGADAFRTAYANFDSKIHVNKNDFITYGLDFMRDAAGAGNLTQTLGHVSIGYIKQLTSGRYGGGEQYLIGSLRGGVGQNSLNWGNLWFGRQYDVEGATIDINAPSGEPITGNIGNSNLYGDLGGGLMWYTLWDERQSLYIGLSGHHLNKPNIGLTGSAADILYSRITVHTGGEVPLNTEMSLLPNVVMHFQGPSFMVVPGVQVRYTHKDWREVALRFGIFTRVANNINGITNDALILSTSFEYENAVLGLSYDVSTSSILAGNSGRGAFELAIQYKNPNTRYRHPLKCPKF